jgi:hypothetical protein
MKRKKGAISDNRIFRPDYHHNFKRHLKEVINLFGRVVHNFCE